MAVPEAELPDFTSCQYRGPSFLPSSRFTFVERGQASSGMEALCQALSAARSKSPLLGVGP